MISVGMNTVELLVTRSGASQDRFTAGRTAGVRRLLDLVNPDGLYSLGELDTQLRAGKLDVAAALLVWEREVVSFIERRWGHASQRFAAVIAVQAGGAERGPAAELTMSRGDGRGAPALPSSCGCGRAWTTT